MRWIEFLVEVIVAEMDGKPDIQRSAELLSRTRLRASEWEASFRPRLIRPLARIVSLLARRKRRL